MTMRLVRVAAALAGAAALMMAQGKIKSPKEQEALVAINTEKNPEAKMKLVDEFITQFADTEWKGWAYQRAAEAAQQKGDSVKALVYAQNALEADPKSFQSMLLISGELARTTRENDLDKEEKLARSEKLANTAMDIIKAAPKPNPQLTDDQWTGVKKDLTSMGHEDLGLAAMVRKKFDVAITEFKTAVDSANTPDPATMVRLATAYNDGGKPDEALAVLAKIPDNANPVVKQFAQTQKTRAEQAKNGKK